MADNYIMVQLKFSGARKSPIVAGDRRLTAINLRNLLNGVNSGDVSKGFAQTPVGVQMAVASSLVAASATATPASVINADTLTIAGTALTATQRRATGTITFATAVAGNTITLNGVVFTAVNGAVTPGQATFDISGGNTTGAASFVSQLAAFSSPLLDGIVSARSAAAVVTAYAVQQGTAGNSITLASSGATLAVSGAVLAGGSAIANNTFDFAGSNVTTGAAIAAAINASTTAAVQRVTATSNSSTGVVTVTAKLGGAGGNAITFVSSNGTRLAVTGSGFLASGAQGEPVSWNF